MDARTSVGFIQSHIVLDNCDDIVDARLESACREYEFVVGLL